MLMLDSGLGPPPHHGGKATSANKLARGMCFLLWVISPFACWLTHCGDGCWGWAPWPTEHRRWNPRYDHSTRFSCSDGVICTKASPRDAALTRRLVAAHPATEGRDGLRDLRIPRPRCTTTEASAPAPVRAKGETLATCELRLVVRAVASRLHPRGGP